MNAANEEAVASFLDGRIAFTAIPETIADAMRAHPPTAVRGLSDVLEADVWARTHTRSRMTRPTSVGTPS